MKLINSFDTKFPSLYGAKRNVQNDHIEKVSSILSGCVVSVASFNGETRLSVCTGIAIECNLYTSILTSASLVRSSDDENKIDDNLRIEVHLPNKQRAMGKLQHYSLDYNIAVVNVQNSLDLKAAYINHQIQFESHCNVIAVGRLFKSGKFIATCGRLTDEPSKLDCKELSTSNCKISKVGIGGPLVDSDGYFVGMNFYDEEVTPFLPRDIILECLRNFETRYVCNFWMRCIAVILDVKTIPRCVFVAPFLQKIPTVLQTGVLSSTSRNYLCRTFLHEFTFF
nr:uncharacterized protein LOC127307922 isoform X3 [Lolium perenne]XP_051194649.1 uncharacterized protein LOC127307922 isoform X3 [Lolium perenne]XP_051194650.1 uncharacterized protein LOC127307922 isoform X3 [Lolium perenne]